MPVKLHRTNKGPRFNEGARLAWLALGRKKWTQARLREELGCADGLIARWLYGDRVPSAKWAAMIERVLGIRSSKWAESASQSFLLPAANDTDCLKRTGTDR